MIEVEVRHNEACGLYTVTLTVPNQRSEVEGEGATLHEAFFDLAEQLENEVSR